MTFFRGGFIGLFGSGCAHVFTALLDRVGSHDWLRGPYGPPFFNLALFTGIFYAAVGLAAGRRARFAAVGFSASFFTLLLPLFIMTRYGGWRFDSTALPSPWRTTVVIIYTTSIWSAIAAIGAACAPEPRWRGIVAAVLGSLAAYAMLALLQSTAGPLLSIPWNPHSLWPTPINLLDGFFAGACLSLAIQIDARRRSARTAHMLGS